MGSGKVKADSRQRPQLTDTQRISVDRYWRFARISLLIGMGLHVAFALVGLLIGALPLTLLQAASISVYAISYVLVGTGARWPVTPLVWFDLLGHATAATLILGVDSGFQFHSWILMPIVFANPSRPLRNKLCMAVALSVLYMALDWWLRQQSPSIVVSAAVANALRYFNITCYLAALGGMTWLYARTASQAEQKLRATAGTDALTGLLNRRRMSDRLQTAISRARVDQRPLAVMLLDIDEFKSINDRYGHNRGDQVIVRIGEVLKSGVREQDLVSRWGGEEFLILLPGTCMEAAHELSERLRNTIARTVRGDEQEARAVTVTIGVAAWRNDENLEDTIHRADKAMYRGKNAGRNVVVVDGMAA